tara:strand:+ start:3123 stop:3359 length:237 start_codon:yes stop_codon:yes gene_type:complete
MKNNEPRPLPKWFDGEVYTQGGIARNPYTGETAVLNANELTMYDLILGAERLGAYKVLQRGLGWFRLANAAAYMVLLD